MAVASMKIEGLQALKDNLQAVGSTGIRAVGRRAVQAASTPVLATARKMAPVDSKALKRSLGKKIVTYRSSGVSAAIIGPRVGFAKTIIDKTGRRVLRDPVRYAHLLEKGHRIALGSTKSGFILKRADGKTRPGKTDGWSGGNVQAHPFMVPALNVNHSRVMQILETKVTEGLAREIAKKASKNK